MTPLVNQLDHEGSFFPGVVVQPLKVFLHGAVQLYYPVIGVILKQPGVLIKILVSLLYIGRRELPQLFDGLYRVVAKSL